MLIPILMLIGLMSNNGIDTEGVVGVDDGGHSRLRSRWGWGSLMIEGKNCYSPDFRKRTLKLIDEETIEGLLGGVGDGSGKFEASAVVGVGNVEKDGYLVAFDNMFEMGLIHVVEGSGGMRVKRGELVEWGGKKELKDGSEFEAIVANGKGGFIVVQEVVEKKGGLLLPAMWDVELETLKNGSKRMKVNEECLGDFEFSHDNSGFEGVDLVKDADGKEFLLGLCEKNYCTGGERGYSQTGNGRIVVMEKTTVDGKCRYKTKKALDIPRSADFHDYSAMDIRGDRIAIVSQENSAVWIGKFKPGKNGHFHFGKGKTYDFPRNDACLIKYCNIEGIYWITDNAIAAVSDKMKSKGKQSFRCLEKDQMIHTFALPR